VRVRLVLLVVAVCFGLPGWARADVLIVPYLGQSWSGVINDAYAGYPASYGVKIEWVSGGVLGLGLDATRTPDFLGDAEGRVSDSTLSSYMANVVVGRPLSDGKGFRPYLSAGAGVIRYSLTRTGGAQVSGTDFGYNVGAGVQAMFNRRVGAEFDLRYFRNTQDFTPGGLDFPEPIMEYARWSGGLVVRF
jgi:opacity protein-like surface antigen